MANEPMKMSALRIAMSMRLTALRSISRPRFWWASIFRGLMSAEWKAILSGLPLTR